MPTLFSIGIREVGVVFRSNLNTETLF